MHIWEAAATQYSSFWKPRVLLVHLTEGGSYIHAWKTFSFLSKLSEWRHYSILQIKSNQITFIVTSPQHKCLGEWNSYERAPDSAEKQQTIYIWTDSAKKQQTIYIWTDSAKNSTGAFTVLQTVQKKQQQQFTYGQTVQKSNSNLHMDRQCKKATAIYIWTVHIYRLYRRQCAKYTYIYSVHIVYYKDILNYQRHIIHRMGASTLCTVSIHNVVYA